jgi:hypothetical protein
METVLTHKEYSIKGVFLKRGGRVKEAECGREIEREERERERERDVFHRRKGKANKDNSYQACSF